MTRRFAADQAVSRPNDLPRLRRLGSVVCAVALLWCAALIPVVRPVAAEAAPSLRACDYYKAAGTPCVAAHSTTRALFARYNGPLYAVQRASDGKSRNIPLLAPGDYADAAVQDSFCANSSCIITVIYDQTKNGNDLTIEAGGEANPNPDAGAPADALPVTAGGHQVYGILVSGLMGYRNDHTTGVATNGQPETMYMVTSGTHTNGPFYVNGQLKEHCCFDYGNVETNNRDNNAGHMDAINFSMSCRTETATKPWVKADLENGLFASNTGCSSDASEPEPHVTALLKNNGQNFFSLKSGDAHNGPLTTGYAGALPNGYSPMHQEGAIVLGTGGDNSNNSIGSFFEGVMTTGVSPDYADDQVQADIVNVGYGGPTGLEGKLRPGYEISLKARELNASAYLSHRHGPSDDEKVVTETVRKWDPYGLRASATWIVRRGFSKTDCLAFESQNLPGAFLSHDNERLVVVPDDGSATFAANATFCPVAGLDGSGSSFQAANAHTRYIRVYDQRGYIASDGGPHPQDSKTGWKKDVSWGVDRPLAP